MISFGSIILRGGWWLPVLGTATLAGTLGMLALPSVLGGAVDALVDGGTAGRWLALAAGLVGLAVVADLIEAYAATVCVATTTAWLRDRLVRHVLAISPEESRRLGTGELVSRVSGNAVEAAQAGVGTINAVAAAIPPIGSLALLAYIDLRLALAFLIGAALCAAVLRAFARRTAEVTAGYQRVQGRIAGMLAESLAGRRTVAAAGTLDREIRRVLEPLDELHRQGRRTWTVLARSVAEAGLAGPLVLVSVLAAGGVLLVSREISAGELFAASQYAVIGAGLGGLTGVMAQLARARAGARRLADVFAVEPVHHGGRSLPDGPGRLELRGVTVRAGTNVLVDGLDLVVPGGTAVAVVGASGAGKSVLAELAARLRVPDEGEVLLVGVPLTQLTHAALRSAIGYAFERPVLVGRIVAETIGADQDREPVRASARATHADEFVSRLPMGYDTPLAMAPLSGGEIQRLGLARAWRAGRLLVLDDATSSLDMVTEMQIGRTLTDDGVDRTRLIITHRASTAARADAVVWLDGGRIRATGSHDRLWREPAYREIFAAAAEPTVPAEPASAGPAVPTGVAR